MIKKEAIRSYAIKPILHLYNKKHNKKNLNCKVTQLKLLKQLLEENQLTSFGKYYSFKTILSNPEERYARKVPIHKYEDIYNKWWIRSHKEKEQNVFWNEPINYFALSSGTSGGPNKFLPISKSGLNSMSKTTTRMFSQLASMSVPSNKLVKQILWVGGSSKLNDDEGVFTGKITGINAKFRPKSLSKIFKPELDITDLPSWDDRLELMLERAPQWDIGVICGLPSWVTLFLEKVIEKYNLNSILDIWPNIHTYVSGGVHFSPFKEKLFQLVGKEIIVRDTYMASEGFFAYQYGHNNDLRMRLNLKEYFIEGIAYNNEKNLNENNPVIPCYEFEEHVDYALVITNKSGAWRYLIGDIIRLIDKTDMTIKVVGRTSQSLSVAGEHLTGGELLHAVQSVSEKKELECSQFMIEPIIDRKESYHKWYISINGPVDESVIAENIDNELKKGNEDYRVEREIGVLGAPRVNIIEDKQFYNWLNQKENAGGQSKLPLVLNKEQAINWNQFLIKK